MNITKTEDKIIFEFPACRPRYNPYMDDDEQHLLGTYPTFTGLIIENEDRENEMGFAHTIDMDYTGKPDQIGSFAVMWDGDEESFKKKCEELGIGCRTIVCH